MSFQIISDGSCDLGAVRAAQHHVRVVPFSVTFDGETYRKEIEELEVRDFYQQMIDHPDQFPKTSLPSVQEYVDVFTEYAREGIDVLCICITTKFSGSYNSACNAADLVREEYPDAVIRVFDSQVNTVLQGIFTLEAARMRDAGMSLEDTLKRMQQMIPSARILFTVGNYEYLVHGGRIGKLLGAMVGGLGIRPLIELKEGEIFPAGIARGRKRSVAKVVTAVQNHFRKTGENPDDYQLCIGYGYDRAEAEVFRKDLLTALEPISGIRDVELFQIGATIGAHTGPYPLGVGLLRKYDTY